MASEACEGESRPEETGNDQMQKKQSTIFPKLTRMEMAYLLLCFCIYLFWMMTFTMWEYGPDEYMRYDIPKFIFTNGALPIGPEESIRNPIWGISYGFTISLTYILEACFMWIASLFSGSETVLLLSARFVNVLSAVGTTYFAMLIAKRKMPGNALRWVFITLMSLLPQIVFLASYVNNDTFSLLTVAMILYGWIVCLERQWDIPALAFLSVGLGLCLLSYYFAYSYVLMTVFVYVAWHLLHKEGRSFATFIKKGLLILLIAFAISGWFFVRNAILYNGDIFSLNASRPYAEMYAMGAYKPSMRRTVAGSGIGVVEMLIKSSWIRGTYKSMIGVFGYLATQLPSIIFMGYTAVFAIGAVGALAKAVSVLARGQGLDHHKDSAIIWGGMVLASMVTVGISVYFSWSYNYQPQGRYIIVAMPCLSLMTATGWDWWMEKLGKHAAQMPRLCGNARQGFAYLVFGFNLISVFLGYLICLKAFVY